MTFTKEIPGFSGVSSDHLCVALSGTLQPLFLTTEFLGFANLRWLLRKPLSFQRVHPCPDNSRVGRFAPPGEA